MSASSSIQSGKAAAEAAVVHQVYLTHCVQTDSFRNEAGFSVRATSTNEPELLRFATDYPGLELPIDMWGTDPSPEKTPRRLALVQAPGGRSALIHSSYLRLDTRGRPGNYFTHILVYPRLSMGDALESWGSSDWTLDYRQGETKDLRPFPRPQPAPPRQGKLDREALTRFLRDPQFPRDSNLATTLCPERLLAQPEQRQQLVRMALTAGLLIVREGAAGARRNLYLMTEPGLGALLLYAIARLLPGRQVEGLTFSTYEPQHRSFRQFKGAQVMCTFLKDPDKATDGDSLHARGYMLDTFQPGRSSPELARGAEPIQELVAWAGAGEWERVRELHRLHGPGPVTLDTLRAARRLLDLGQRLKAGQVTLDEVRGLAGSSEGQALLDEHEQVVWKLVREGSLANPQARRGWEDLLLKHIAEVKRDAARCLSLKGWERWETYWGLISELRRAEPEPLRTDLLEILRAAQTEAHPREVAERLLLAWGSLKPGPADWPREVRGLLEPATAGELQRLLKTSLPASWQARALRHAIDRDATRAHAIEALRTGADRLLPAFLEGLKDFPPEQMPNLLDALVAGDPEADASFLDRLLTHGDLVPVEALLALLNGKKTFKRDWNGFWAQDERLLRLFECLKGTPAVRNLWQHYARELNRKLLFGDPTQAAILTQLRKECARRPEALGESCASEAAEWTLLARLFTEPGAAKALDYKEVRAAVKARELDSDKLLHDHFGRLLQDKSADDPEYLAFLGVVDKFCEQWTSLNDAQRQQNAFGVWLKLTEVCADEDLKMKHQVYYLRNHVDPQWQADVARFYQQRDSLSAKTVEYLRKHPAKGVPKAAAERRTAGEERPASRSGREDGPGLWQNTWVKVGIGAGLLVAGLILGLLFAGGRGSGDGRPDPDKKPAKTGKKKAQGGEKKTPPNAVVQPAILPKGLLLDDAAVKQLEDTVRILTNAVTIPELGEIVYGKELLKEVGQEVSKLGDLPVETLGPEGGNKARAHVARLHEAVSTLVGKLEARRKELAESTKPAEERRRQLVLWAYRLSERETRELASTTEDAEKLWLRLRLGAYTARAPEKAAEMSEDFLVREALGEARFVVRTGSHAKALAANLEAVKKSLLAKATAKPPEGKRLPLPEDVRKELFDFVARERSIRLDSSGKENTEEAYSKRLGKLNQSLEDRLEKQQPELKKAKSR
jgi:hypothetical protein